jgi:hypothetical protein
MNAIGPKILLGIGYIAARGMAVYPGLLRLLAHKGNAKK